MSPDKNGIVQVKSAYSLEETLERLESALRSKGVIIFARIDFSGDAERAGLNMNPTRLLIVGNPRAGTPLMVASPTVAIDLPLKILVSEDEDGAIWMSYNSSEYLKERHGIPEELLRNIAGIGPIVESVSK